MKKLTLLFAVLYSLGGNAQCTCSNMGPELVINGDFSSGNTGFTSNYTYSSFAWPGYYGVTTNANTNNSNWCSGGDHTSGSGNFFWVDADNTTPNVLIWQETFTVLPNTNHVFSCWVNTLDPQGPGTLQFSINNQLVGAPFTAPVTLCNWVQFCVTWNSGSNTTATIGIANQSTFFAGNDMGIDDISFKECQTTSCIVTAVISPNDTICQGNNTQLTSSGGTQYTWLPAMNLNNPFISNPVATPATTTTYTVTVSNGQCSDTATVTITVNPSPIASTGPGVSICSGSSTNLAASGGNSYSWQPATGLSSTTVSSPVATPSSTTTYTVTVSNGSCSDTASVTVVVVNAPIALVGPDQTICIGSSAQLNASGGVTFTWSPATGLNDPFIANPIATPSISTTYTVTTSNGLCSSSASVTVTIIPPPVAVITANYVSGYAPLTVSFTNGSVNAATSLFTLSNSDTSYYSDFSFTYNEPGTYTVYLVVANSNGCLDSTAIVIEVKPVSGIWAPNAFTPQGDGLNDIFKAETFGIVEFEAWIFDRWGNLIFNWTDKDKGWDGTMGGKIVEEDVYVWKIRALGVDGIHYKPVGHVSVIR